MQGDDVETYEHIYICTSIYIYIYICEYTQNAVKVYVDVYIVNFVSPLMHGRCPHAAPLYL